MSFEIKKKIDLLGYMEDLLLKEFEFSKYQTQISLYRLSLFLQRVDDSVYVGIESPYIDKLYRNSYYHYYSSKLSNYKRDCVRLSFFSCDISLQDFFDQPGVQKIGSNFLGFLVIRPTFPSIFGRNILRPDIFSKTTPYHVVVTNGSAAINGIKLSIEGFPHSSQDGELMVCAETTIWSVMEYFSNRYPEYKPVLPSDINEIIAATSNERQIPSSGLTGIQISYALKELGFGVKLYSPNSYTTTEFFKIIQIYVESGIPVIAGVENTLGTGHVMNFIGRTEFLDPNFTFSALGKMDSGSEIYDFYEQPCRYIVIDDNHPPYSEISLNDPACNYTDPKWAGCYISAAIVPLYHRIYMEADRAKELALQEIKKLDKQLGPLPSYVLRVLLGSSRSFKHAISLNPDLDASSKTIIVNMKMPKFVWIAELSTPAQTSVQKACGMILMDATEPKKPEILAKFVENVYIGTINAVFGEYSLPLQPFAIFRNLKSF